MGCTETNLFAIHLDAMHVEIMSMNMVIWIDGKTVRPMLREDYGFPIILSLIIGYFSKGYCGGNWHTYWFSA